MMPVTKKDLVEALGKELDSPEVETLKKSIQYDLIEDDFALPNERYFLCKEKGISLTFKNNILSSMHLHLSENDSYKKFLGWIGDGIDNSESSLSNIIDLLGEPTHRGGGGQGFMGKIDLPWIRYDFHDYAAHYTFFSNEHAIKMVVLMNREFSS